MEIERKDKFIHGIVVLASTLVIVIVALVLLVFLFTTPATRQEANVQKQLEHQISQYPKGYKLKQLINLEEGRVSRFLLGLYDRCVQGVTQL